MANVNVTYGEMTSAADRLVAGKAEIESQLAALVRQVEGLVSGGYVTDSSSAAFLDAYTLFNTSCTGAIAGLDGMAAYLKTAAATFEEADRTLAGALR